MRVDTLPRRSKRLAEEIANTRFERILGNAAQLAIVFIGLVAVVVTLRFAQVIIAPVMLAVLIGLVFGPIADLLERRGVPDFVSAAIVVLGFVAVLAGGLTLFAAPLAEWVERIPGIWNRLQAEIRNLQAPIDALAALQEQIRGILGGEADLKVSVEDTGAVLDVAMLAPAILSQVVIFHLSLYFFIATRDSIRISALSLCVTRRLRWRMAHVFRDVENKVSRYLLTITMVNLGVGAVVTLLMWAIGMPTPLLWGAMAALLNYVPFVGQGLMALILFLVGMGTAPDLTGALLPVALYFGVNFIEGNFVTPNLLGRAMMVNPFLIFLSLAFWLWTWGPVGGLVAVPSLLVLISVATHILPIHDATPPRERRKAARQATRDAGTEPVPPPTPGTPQATPAELGS